MKMRFLCVRHRRWLAADPAAAMFTWLQCYEQGLRLEQQRRDNLAIRQAGCAMETADLLLASRQRTSRDDITRYTHSALLLARLLRRQGAFDLAGDVTHSAIASLERLLIADIQRDAVTTACEQLAPLALPCSGANSRSPGSSARQLH